MSAEISLAHGNCFPYDAPDEWWEKSGTTPPPLPLDWSHSAARGIIADLKDRHTIKWSFENIDEETRIEIVKSLSDIIQLAFQKGTRNDDQK